MASNDSEFVRFLVSHSVLDLHGDNYKPFAVSLTLDQLKLKLERIVGTAPQWMELSLLDAHTHEPIVQDLSALEGSSTTIGDLLAEIDDEQRTTLEIHVKDVDPSNTLASTLNATVEKRVLSEEENAKRTDSVRALRQDRKKREKEAELQRAASALAVGDRCAVDGVEVPGVVRYLGEVENTEGLFVGVELDSAEGKNDGSAKGRRYFECPPGCGIFVRPTKVHSLMMS